MKRVAAKPLIVSAIVVLLLCWPVPTKNVQPTAHANRSDLRIGIAYGNRLPFMTDDELARALDDAVDIGARWVRLDLSWADIQPDSPQDYLWDRFDRVADAAAARGLSLLPILAYTPAWARLPGCADEKCAPADPGEFAAFAAAAAARYPQVSAWEVWNEENYGVFWRPEPDPISYAALLKSTIAGLRMARPAAEIVVGGLANVDEDRGGIAPASFLAVLVRTGAMADVDGVGLHYPDTATLRSVRSVLSNAGVSDTPIWITEDGAPTGGEGVDDAVAEGEQARRVTAAVTAASGDPRVAALFWYTDRDGAAELTDPESHYGLRRLDGSKKPAYSAFHDAIAQSGD